MSHRLVIALLVLQGLAPGTLGFYLCGWRLQFSGTGVLQYYGNSSDDTMTVENTLEGVIVRSPYPPSTKITIHGLPGPYSFCVYWFPGLQSFTLTYGSRNFTWDVQPDPGVKTKASMVEPLESCEVNTTIINMTVNGKRQNSSCRYHFHLTQWSKDTRFVEREMAMVGQHLDKVPVTTRKAKELRGWIDRSLSQVQFEGHSQHFGKGALRASVYKLASADMLQSIHQEKGVSVSFPRELVEYSSSLKPTRLHVVRVQGHSLFQDTCNSSVLSDQVIGISVENRKISNLAQSINFTFQHQPVKENYTSVCVFWKESGRVWSTEGCETEPHRSQTKCKCNHLTYFAVLMRVSSQTISEAHLVYLSVITFAGCSISALAALFTICCFQCNRKRSSNPTIQIHMNLLGALLLLDLSFMCSAILGAVPIPALCQCSAILLHIAQLCTFTWMAIEGFNLYRLVVKVFNSSSITTGKLAVVGWGAPVLIVLVIILMDQNNYGDYDISVNRSASNESASLCWLTDPTIHNVVNLGFFATVLLFNIVMLVAMTRQVLRLTPHNRGEQVRHCITLLGLSCMLGLPWALAFCAFGELYLPMQYVFSILNSLQGFLIFLWYWALSQPHVREPSRSYESTSATPASPRGDPNSSSWDEKKPLT
ncbi:adhesion G-protein coupled receptor G1-like [Discoglossus pictus]